MKYMCTIYMDESLLAMATPQEVQQVMAAHDGGAIEVRAVRAGAREAAGAERVR